MQGRRLGKVAAIVLVLAVAGGIGAFTAAHACDAFKVAFSQADPVTPGSSGQVVASGLHDQFCNLTTGDAVAFSVTLPGASTPTSLGTANTGAGGDPAGTAHVAFSNTSKYGTYALKATANAGAIVANGAMNVGGLASVGTFTLSKTDATPKAGQDLHLVASGLHDSNNKPVSNGQEVTFTLAGPAGFSKSYPAATSGVVTSADTAKALLTVPASDMIRAGSYTVSATSGPQPPNCGGASQPACGAIASPNLVFDVAAGAVASLSSAVAALPVVVGTNYEIDALNALDSYGNKAAGQPVSFTITTPLGSSNIPTSGTLTLDANGNASAITTAANASQAYGTYSLVAKSGTTSSAAFTYDVEPGAANGITGFVSNKANSPAGTPVVLTVGSIKYNTYAAKNGTLVTLHEIDGPDMHLIPAQTQVDQQTLVSGVTKGNDVAGVSFTIPAELLTHTGQYTYSAAADSAVAQISFNVVSGSAVGDLVVTAPDTEELQDATISVGGVPGTTTTVTLRVTRPDGSVFTINGAPNGNPTSMVIPAANNLTMVGKYKIDAYTKNGSGAITAFGEGFLNVIATVPDKIDVSAASPIVVPVIGGQVITATATKAGSPVGGISLTYTVRNLLGETVASSKRTTGPDGKITVTIDPASMLIPGPYSVLVEDDSGVEGTASFIV